MSIGRICCREVHLASPEESAEEAAKRMAKRRVGTLVVLDERSSPIGILTDRDLVTRVLAPGKAAAGTPVGDVMTERPRVVSEETPIESALAAMRAGNFRRLPVVDGDRKLVGIVSLDDILELLAEEFSDIGKLLHTQIPEPTHRVIEALTRASHPMDRKPRAA